jgi:phage head maturation protease
MFEVRRFGAFTKAQERDDGSIVVEGICSAEQEDSQGDVILADAMRRAIPSYLQYPAIREQHDPQRAAGRALAMEVDGQGRTWISAHVVDPVTVQKVKAKVLTGFSVGGRVPPGGRDPDDSRIVRSLVLCEVSLVDRPALDAATVTMWKAEGLGDDGEAISKVARERDAAIHKAVMFRRERDEAFAKAAVLGQRVQKAERERDHARAEHARLRKAHAAEVAALERELRARPKGYAKAIPVEIEKADDNRTAPKVEREPEDVHTLIRRAQTSPIAVTLRR